MSPMIPRRVTPRYREVPSTRWSRLRWRCHAAWHLWHDRKHLSEPGKRSLLIAWNDGVCPGCHGLTEVNFCGQCGRGAPLVGKDTPTN
jgi:hypothetical protein